MSGKRLVSEKALAALNEAALSIAGDLSLEGVLQQITDSARSLVGARFGALGVPDGDGELSQFLISGMDVEAVRNIAHQPKGTGILGTVLKEGRSVRIPHLIDDPRAAGFPSGHPAMTSFLGVPVVASNETLGNLYLTDKVGPSGTDAVEFTAEDQRLVEMFAAHAAIAIQNASLYEQVARLAVVEERSRIGMDLHDGVIQSIYAVGLILESTRMLGPEDGSESRRLLDQAIGGLNDAIRDIRNFILDLRPQRFSGDLGAALARLNREFQANTMVPVQLNAPARILGTIPMPAARTIFLTSQEGLANVARHARAKNVSLEIARDSEMVILSITDDGIGFDDEQQLDTLGHGLANMHLRAEEGGGEFTVSSAPGKGTSILLKLPC